MWRIKTTPPTGGPDAAPSFGEILREQMDKKALETAEALLAAIASQTAPDPIESSRRWIRVWGNRDIKAKGQEELQEAYVAESSGA